MRLQFITVRDFQPFATMEHKRHTARWQSALRHYAGGTILQYPVIPYERFQGRRWLYDSECLHPVKLQHDNFQ